MIIYTIWDFLKVGAIGFTLGVFATFGFLIASVHLNAKRARKQREREQQRAS